MSAIDVRGESLPDVVAGTLRERIVAGHWLPGDRLPSEHALADEFAVSRATVRTALQRLELAGLVRTVHGAGSVVSADGSTARQSLHELTATLDLLARQGHDCEVRHRSRQVRAATPLEARRLERPGGTTVVAYTCAFVSDPGVVAYEHGVVPTAAFGPDVDPTRIRGDLLGFLAGVGTMADRAVTTITAAADPDIAWRELAPHPATFLVLDQVRHLPAGGVIAWTRTHLVAAHVALSMLRSI